MNDQREEPIKLIDKVKPETPQPQQQQFPLTNVNVTPQGLVITTHLNATSQFTQILPMDALKQILPMIKEALKSEQTILQTIQQVQRSKLH